MDVIEFYMPSVQKIMKNNLSNSTFQHEFRMYMIDSSMYIMENYLYQDQRGLPREIAAQMNAYAIVTVFEWVYVKQNPLSREEMTEYILRLLH